MGLRLHEFYDMPFNELSIAFIGHEEKEERREFEMKFLAWHSMIGPHMNPSKIPSFEQFTRKSNAQKSRMTDDQRERFIQSAKEYELKKKAKQ